MEFILPAPVPPPYRRGQAGTGEPFDYAQDKLRRRTQHERKRGQTDTSENFLLFYPFPIFSRGPIFHLDVNPANAVVSCPLKEKESCSA